MTSKLLLQFGEANPANKFYNFHNLLRLQNMNKH